MLRQACPGQEVHSACRDRPTRLAALLLARSALNPRGRNTPRGNEKPWLWGVVARPMLRGQRCREVVGSCAAMRLTRGLLQEIHSLGIQLGKNKRRVGNVSARAGDAGDKPGGETLLQTSSAASALE